MIREATINGRCARAYAAARDAFAATFAEDLNQGAGFSVWRDGAPLVELYGGFADDARTRAFGASTLVHVWSVTKALTALVVARLVADGALRYDQPVAEIWPAFGVGGKDTATIGHVLAHQAGVPGTATPMTDADLIAHAPYAEALAAEPAMWPPGELCAYHPISGGHILNEVVRRATGRTIGAHLQDDVVGPRRLDIFLGLPERLLERAAETLEAPGLVDERATRAENHPKARDAILNPPLLPEQANTPEWAAAEIPAGNAYASAESLARLFDAVLRGSVVPPDALAEATAERYAGPDFLVGTPLRLSNGFMLNGDDRLFGPNPNAFGHTGWGGAFAFADPDAKLAVAFTPNLMLPDAEALARRRALLLDSVYRRG